MGERWKFSVQSFFEALENKCRLVSHFEIFGSGGFVKVWAFNWEAYWGVLTRWTDFKEGICTCCFPLSICMMCLEAVESANYLFLHFEVAKVLLWPTGVCWLILLSVKDAIVQRKLLFISERAKALVGIYLYVLSYGLFGRNVTIPYSRTKGWQSIYLSFRNAANRFLGV